MYKSLPVDFCNTETVRGFKFLLSVEMLYLLSVLLDIGGVLMLYEEEQNTHKHNLTLGISVKLHHC
jgi:hypothetical protein